MENFPAVEDFQEILSSFATLSIRNSLSLLGVGPEELLHEQSRGGGPLLGKLFQALEPVSQSTFNTLFSSKVLGGPS